MRDAILSLNSDPALLIASKGFFPSASSGYMFELNWVSRSTMTSSSIDVSDELELKARKANPPVPNNPNVIQMYLIKLFKYWALKKVKVKEERYQRYSKELTNAKP